jgi:NAD(P)-dependent dehydrogenase (short-subunit alcohol dehydrogenase family)
MPNKKMTLDYIKKFSLNNKKAFVVGGSGLLGSEIIGALISASANVINLDKDFKKSLILKKKYSSKQLTNVLFDAGNFKNIDKKIISLFKKFGCPDILINCSYPVTKNWSLSSFNKNKLSILRKNIDIHLNSYSWLSFKFCEKMKKEKIKGSIIMLSSIYGVVAQNPEIYRNTKLRENMNYAIIKGGINNLTKQLAAYYGANGIRVNSVCSGGIIGHVKGSQKKQSQKFKSNYSKNCPLKRLGRPDEIASSVLFLASNASSYITGTSFLVDGGWTAI